MMKVNVMLFPDFETLDAFGAAEILSRIEEYELCFFSSSGGIIVSRQGIRVATEKQSDADFAGILLVPGGHGTRSLVKDAGFIRKLAGMAEKSRYCLTVCTGSALLAKTGLIDGKRATSNKRAMDWVKTVSPRVAWADCARWVVDGKFYTSSGVSAGIDMALGFVSDRFGRERAESIADGIEYVWNSNQANDPFAGSQ